MLYDMLIAFLFWNFGGIISSVSAYGADDGIALVVAMILVICGVMACLGAYAKKTGRT